MPFTANTALNLLFPTSFIHIRFTMILRHTPIIALPLIRARVNATSGLNE